MINRYHFRTDTLFDGTLGRVRCDGQPGFGVRTVTSPSLTGEAEDLVDAGRRVVFTVVLMTLLPASYSLARSTPATDLHIASDGDNLAFHPDRLACSTGVIVRLHFRHRGELVDDSHDWVLLKSGTESAFLAIADQADGRVAIPRGTESMVLAATPLCARGKTVTVRFLAPPPGSYPFVCSIPGHGDTMRGILTVSSSTNN